MSMIEIKQLINITSEDTASLLKTDLKNGLNLKEVENRQKKYGKNVILEQKKHLIFWQFLNQFKDLFAIILIIASFLSFIAGSLLDALVILGIVLVNATIGFFQEYRAEKATRALKKLLPSYCKVIREGQERKILVSDLVPGDLIVLEEGDSIPADCRIIEEYELSINNSTLTGEFKPKRKTAKKISKHFGRITDAPNIVFMGTEVFYGSGKAIVVNTGMNTEFGKIAQLTQSITTEYSPLQLELAQLAKTVTKIVIIIGVLGMVIGWWMGKPLVEMFLFALGIMVACVPEGLPATVSVALAAGVQRMVKKNALLKRLSAVETLGSTSVICTDKTGTITKGEITVKKIWIWDQEFEVSGTGYNPSGSINYQGKKISLNNQSLILLLKIAALCNDAKLIPPHDKDKKWQTIGDPTEDALLTLVSKAGLNYEKIAQENKRIYELSFNSIRKRMSTIHQDRKGDIQVFTKGAPESILSCCTHILIDGRRRRITTKDKEKILNCNKKMAQKAYRVLAFAWRDLPDKKSAYTIEKVEKDLTFVGLCGMIDPPREEVLEAVKKTYEAGIKIIMITGDYSLTAKAIAQQVGIANLDTEVIEGGNIDQLSDEELKEKLNQRQLIFARVTPEHKMRIVNLLKEKGEIVAVTGDGVNDAPALKAADIGVAMGINGTDVSKESADMILLDDSFATITAAIEEGRRIYDNIKKFNLYVFSSNVGELFSVIYGVIFRIPLPIIAIQILSIDLGTDVLPSLALGVEPPEEGIMKRPPRDPKESLLNKKVLWHLFKIGIIMASGAVLSFVITLIRNGWHYGQIISSENIIYYKATTITYGTLVVAQLINCLCARSEYKSLFKLGLFSNRYILGAISVSFLMLLSISYVPIANKLWHTAPIDLEGWLLIIIVAIFLFISEEIRKYYLRKKINLIKIQS